MLRTSTQLKYLLQTVAYLERIPTVQGAVESALLALGDGNWKMGEGIQVGKGAKDDEDGNILEHFTRMCFSLIYFQIKFMLMDPIRRYHYHRYFQPHHNLTFRETTGLWFSFLAQQHPLSP